MGGSGAPEVRTKTEGVPLTLPSTYPVRPGYAFLGWSTVKNSQTAEYQPSDSYTQNANATLYAVWLQCDESGLAYDFKNNKLYISGYSGTSQQVTIPAKVDGYSVYGISAGAFTQSENALTIAVQPESIVIEDGAFAPNATIAALPGSSGYTYAKDNSLAFVCLYQDSVITLPAGTLMLENSAFEDTVFKYAELSNSSLFALPDNCFKNSAIKQVHLSDNILYIGTNALPKGCVIVAPEGSYAQIYAKNNGFTFYAD